MWDMLPFAGGSGNFGTPCERMHCATASSSWWSDDAPVEEEPPAPVGVLPPQAAVSRAVTTRAARTPARRRPVSLFIVAILESRNWLLSRQLYAAGGNSTVTGNVTWLSPATCDPGSRRECAAMRVLLAEDDEILARTVAAGLRQEGMAVDVVLDGGDALGHLGVNRYDVLVLDRDIPGVHGDDVCRALAADRAGTRVLMLTAARSVADRVEGLGLGADDYLPKPFDFAELVARIRALARRAAVPLPARLGHGELSVDPARRVAVRAGRRLPLTRKELAVLECLLAAQGRPVSAEELLEQVWDEAADPFTATVKTTIRRLRAKLGDPPMIETVRESGYRIGEP
jgi:DNA-binding response OmpR family regulator